MAQVEALVGGFSLSFVIYSQINLMSSSNLMSEYSKIKFAIGHVDPCRKALVRKILPHSTAPEIWSFYIYFTALTSTPDRYSSFLNFFEKIGNGNINNLKKYHFNYGIIRLKQIKIFHTDKKSKYKDFTDLPITSSLVKLELLDFNYHCLNHILPLTTFTSEYSELIKNNLNMTKFKTSVIARRIHQHTQEMALYNNYSSASFVVKNTPYTLSSNIKHLKNILSLQTQCILNDSPNSFNNKSTPNIITF